MPRVSSDSELEAALASNRPAILRHCYRMVANLAEAEELTQDALERAWNARDTFKGDAPVGHWLMRIATNACLNALARKKRRALPQLENPAATNYEFGRGEPEIAFHLFGNIADGQRSHVTLTVLSMLAI